MCSDGAGGGGGATKEVREMEEWGEKKMERAGGTAG